MKKKESALKDISAPIPSSLPPLLSSQFCLNNIKSVAISLIILIYIPLLLFGDKNNDDLRDESNVTKLSFRSLITVWTGLLHVDASIVFSFTCITIFLYLGSCNNYLHHRKAKINGNDNLSDILLPQRQRQKIIISLTLLWSMLAIIHSQLQIIYPSWIWNPFLWTWFRVYSTDSINQALEGICLDNSSFNRKLCLSEHSWKVLSAEALSSQNQNDVDTVWDGIQYAKHQSGGIVINVLARDVKIRIPSLRKNVEGLVPFFNRVSLVVFENDSIDGTRESFQKWSAESKNYDVDLVECEEAKECRFHTSHRYDSTEAKEYFKSSAIGGMANYRQRIMDFITSSSKYENHSHVMVLDMDLGVSISPLGVMHTLGKLPNNPVASSGRQPWAGSLGSIVPPYDFSAFRPYSYARYERLVKLHESFCALKPPGDRWRNQCDAASSMHFVMVLLHDNQSNAPYRVTSAFNGAVLYPLSLVRSSHATYDKGPDGQRCEHIGFHQSLQSPFYINPKWNFNVNPINPGGPTGNRAAKNLLRIIFTPQISAPIFLQNVLCLYFFHYAVLSLLCCCIFVFWEKMTLDAVICKNKMLFGWDFVLWLFLSKRKNKQRNSNANINIKSDSSTSLISDEGCNCELQQQTTDNYMAFDHTKIV